MRRKPARIVAAAPAIFELFDQLRQKVFTRGELTKILERHRETWTVPAYVSVDRFLTFLQEHGQLRLVNLEASLGVSLTRFAWGSASPLSIGISIRRDAYISHGTAVYV